MGWENTQHGQWLNTNWDSFRKLFGTWLPQHHRSLWFLANRPIDR
jgi:hypothetical protein